MTSFNDNCIFSGDRLVRNGTYTVYGDYEVRERIVEYPYTSEIKPNVTFPRATYIKVRTTKVRFIQKMNEFYFIYFIDI